MHAKLGEGFTYHNFLREGFKQKLIRKKDISENASLTSLESRAF